MSRTTGSIPRFLASRGHWLLAAALLVCAGPACPDQPEPRHPPASPTAGNTPGAKAEAAPRPEPAGATAPDAEVQRQRREGRRRRVAKQREQGYAELGLSDAQQQRIAALREQQRAWYTEHADELEALSEMQRAAKRGEGEVGIEELRQKLLQLYATLPTEHDVLAVLTDEQRAQLRENRANRAPGRAPRRPAEAEGASGGGSAPE